MSGYPRLCFAHW